MQTNFTAEQLRDPDTASSNSVLRTCVHCGLCTATCPTFLLLGDELDSPRGRIYLIKDMLEAGRPATEEVVRHVDRCLSCLSCMTTCPSGVNYMHLVDHARTYIEQTYRRPLPERLLRSLLGLLLPRPGLFRLALYSARLARPLRRFIPGQSMLAQRTRAMLSMAPPQVPSRSLTEQPRVYPAEGPRKARVALLAGCAQQVLMPRINEATIRLLTRLGVEVVVSQGAGCCGALNHHIGQHDSAMALARANIEAWTHEPDLDAIIVNASGCGTTLKNYRFMFRNEPEPWRSRADTIAGLAMDITEFLSRLDYAPTREAPGLTVAYHSACSLQHGQQITAEPKALLVRAGFRVVEPREPHICCGSAGTYNLLQPEIAGRLRERKLGNLKAVKPDLIAAGNIGCITQLSGDTVPVVHTVELLDWMGRRSPATRGPKLMARPRLWLVVCFLCLCAAAQAQTPAEKRASIDHLLDALKSAPDEQAAAMLEAQLEQTWLRAGSPAVTLLMSRGLRSLQAGEDDEAVGSFSDAITLQPDASEAWHQRALARYHAGEVNGAIHDLEETVRLEPRDFAAFRTLAEIAAAREDWKGAYAAWQKVMELDPKTSGGEERLRLLKRKAVGEET